MLTNDERKVPAIHCEGGEHAAGEIQPTDTRRGTATQTWRSRLLCRRWRRSGATEDRVHAAAEDGKMAAEQVLSKQTTSICIMLIKQMTFAGSCSR